MTEERKFVLELIKLLVPPEHHKTMSCCTTESLKQYCLDVVEVFSKVTNSDKDSDTE